MSLIARLLAIGAPADIIEDVAMLIAEARTATAVIEARKRKDRDRKANKSIPRNSRAAAEIAEKESAPPKDYNQTPHAKKNTPLTPQFDFEVEWNAMAKPAGLPTCQAMSRQRKALLRSRLAEFGEANLRKAIAAVGSSPFCRGETDAGWRAGPDFVLKETSLIKLLEGQYLSCKTENSSIDDRQHFLDTKYANRPPSVQHRVAETGC